MYSSHMWAQRYGGTYTIMVASRTILVVLCEVDGL
jgi:hypothetical protein